MNARYKIITAFMLLAIIILATLCVFIYYHTVTVQKSVFEKRLHNRTLTIASLLSKSPGNKYNLLSKLDSATSNLLVGENINVYDDLNRRIYHFDRNPSDTVPIDFGLLNKIRENKYLNSSIQGKRFVGIYYLKAESPAVILVSAVDENGNANLQDLAQSLLISFITGTLLSFIAGWIFSRRLLKPVADITAAVNNISATNIEKRLHESKINDEWNQVSITFNNLLSRLQESFEIQGRFISNASHELSTPLTAIGNQIDVVLQKQRSNEEYLEVLRSVQSDVKQMGALTQQLLNSARTVRGGILPTEPIRIDEIIMEIPSQLKKTNDGYMVHTFFDEFPDNENLFTVNGNYELLLSAFKNIADNACKYSPDNTVSISMSLFANKIVLLFNNAYDSFDIVDADAIFQPFQRGANAMNVEGHGLGLSLARRIIQLHKGEIKAELIGHKKMVVSIILPSLA